MPALRILLETLVEDLDLLLAPSAADGVLVRQLRQIQDELEVQPNTLFAQSNFKLQVQ